MNFKQKAASLLLYGGIPPEDYRRVKRDVAQSNHRALLHWSVLVSLFWSYCLLMSLRAADYARCRAAYAASLGWCLLSYVFSRWLIPRFPKALYPCMFLFRLALLGGGIGIALCQWDVRSLTMFAVAIVAPSIFIDNTVTSVAIHALAVAGYVTTGRGVIDPEIYSWGLGNLILFSVFGFLIGNAICKERFERYVFADSAKQLADMQTRYAYYDQLTGLKNRRAYAEKLHLLREAPPPSCCVLMIDLNGLKRTNDSLGHAAGDELLVGIADCLRKAFPESEDIYRTGGDEFCVIAAEGEARMRRGVSMLERDAANWKGQFVQGVSFAFGTASDRDAADVDAIAREADARMYEAKRRHYAALR